MPGCPLSEPTSPIAPLRDGIPEIARALVVVAHPDDIDFSCAGTVARMTDAGIAVTYLLATRGDQGGFDDTPREEIGPLREREQRAAAAEVGVEDVRFLDERDGHVEPSLALRAGISRVIRQVRPELVVTHNPEWNWDAMPANHPDHMAVGEATTRAVYPDARNPFAFPELLQDEGLEAWTVHELWVLGLQPSNHVVDITEQLPRKIAALGAHASQTAHADIPQLLEGWNGGIAREAGLGTGRYAENFRRVLIAM
ncbi:PIG-L deacetylase family protein [Jatrophihabitans sp. YIM 134969]